MIYIQNIQNQEVYFCKHITKIHKTKKYPKEKQKALTEADYKKKIKARDDQGTESFISREREKERDGSRITLGL